MEVPLGEGTVTVDLPDCAVDVARPPAYDAVDPGTAADGAMSDPHGRPLSTRADPDDEVTIVVTDGTRATPDDVLLDRLFEQLTAAGVDHEQVTILVGLGLHRPMSDDELAAALGEFADLAINHDPDETVTVGHVDGVAIEVHASVADADLVCSTGLVEPHQYAGFSGGAKTVVIGAGGESQIGHTHGPALLGEAGVRLGRIDDNPFRDFLDRAGDAVGVDFCLNVAMGPAGCLGAAAGDHRAVVETLAEQARDALSTPVGSGYDAVVAGVGAPKDATLYQASRGATYVVLGPRNPLRDGGRVVTPARLTEGAGSGRGERRFHEWLSGASDPDALVAAMREGYEAGAQRAFVLGRVLQDHDVWITDSEAPDLVEECLLRAAPDVETAIPAGSDVLVVPDAIETLLT